MNWNGGLQTISVKDLSKFVFNVKHEVSVHTVWSVGSRSLDGEGKRARFRAMMWRRRAWIGASTPRLVMKIKNKTQIMVAVRFTWNQITKDRVGFHKLATFLNYFIHSAKKYADMLSVQQRCKASKQIPNTIKCHNLNKTSERLIQQ